MRAPLAGRGGGGLSLAQWRRHQGTSSPSRAATRHTPPEASTLSLPPLAVLCHAGALHLSVARRWRETARTACSASQRRLHRTARARAIHPTGCAPHRSRQPAIQGARASATRVQQWLAAATTLTSRLARTRAGCTPDAARASQLTHRARAVHLHSTVPSS